MIFEYQTVDVPMYRERPTIELTANEWSRKGWRPVTVITPTEAIPTYSILFEREVESPFVR